MPTLYLLDAMALAYRAHFSFISRPLINSKGENTSASYGFTSALLQLLEKHEIEHIAVVFDAVGEGATTFREEIYPEYKANRDATPEDLLANLPRIKAIVEAMDIPVVTMPGVEADDVIGTLTKRAEEDGAEVFIVSPDKDFQQLVSPSVTIYRPSRKGEQFDPITLDSFREKYGVEPVQFIDLLALMGDVSDNVPGVPGIGPKTAMKLIQQYDSVENLLDHKDEIKGKRASEGLRDYHAEALLSKTLVTIDTNLDVPLEWETLLRAAPDVDELEALFDDLEFKGLARRVLAHARRLIDDGAPPPVRPRGTPGSQASLFGDSFDARQHEDPDLAFDFGPYEPVTAMDESAVTYRLVRSLEDARSVVKQIEKALPDAPESLLAFDTETTSTDSLMASLVGVALSWAEGEAAYLPTPLPDGSQTDAVLDVLRPLLSSARTKVGHNVKYDLNVLATHGLEVAGPFFDTMVAHYLTAPEAGHSLDIVVSEMFSYRMQPIEDLIGKKGKDQITMRDVPVVDAAPYACEDADYTLRLVEPLREAMAKADVDDIARDIEMPLVPVLAAMEQVGIAIDTDVLDAIREEFEGEIAGLETKIYEAAGRTFSIGSTKQLGQVLFNPQPTEDDLEKEAVWLQDMRDKAAGKVEGDPNKKPKTKKQLAEEAPTYGLGLPPVGKTSTGKLSTKESVLHELSTEHEMPGLVLDWRSLTKLKSTYVDALPDLMHPQDERIHTSFNQTVAATGRLSSSGPNLQNIPIRTARGRAIRKAFVPRDGWTLMAADYVQIELRILAAVSGDEALIEAFASGQDIHTITAARVFQIEPEAVTRDQRRKAKEVNYGIPYGVSAFGLAQRLRGPRDEAAELIQEYQRSYPKVAGWLAEQVERARATGHAETLLGRRRYVPQINARNRNERNFAERVAVNMPIQGTQADMIKIAMIRLYDAMQAEGFAAKMLLQVHDELVLEAPPEEVERLSGLVRTTMVDALPLPLDVPVEVDVDTGTNWLDAH